MTEDDWQSFVLDLAHTCGWLVFHARPAQTGRGYRTAVAADGEGFPDLVLVRRGQVLVRELKLDDTYPSLPQKRWLNELGPAGAVWRPRDRALVMEELR